MRKHRTATLGILLLGGLSLTAACSPAKSDVSNAVLPIFSNDYHDRRLLNICPQKRLLTRKDLENLAQDYYLVEADGKPQIVSILEKNGPCRPSATEQLDLLQAQCSLVRDRQPCQSGIVQVPIP
jgi:hypothetical protein